MLVLFCFKLLDHRDSADYLNQFWGFTVTMLVEAEHCIKKVTDFTEGKTQGRISCLFFSVLL